MKIFGWALVALAGVTFVLSFLADARIAPIVGAAVLFGAILYATWMTNTAPRENLRKAERGARKLHDEIAREDAEREGSQSSAA